MHRHAEDRNELPALGASEHLDGTAVDIRIILSRSVGKELILVALFLATFAISEHPIDAQEQPASPAKTLDKVVLQLTWHHEFQFAGSYTAQQKGFYAKEGLEGEIKERNLCECAVDWPDSYLLRWNEREHVFH